MAAVETRTTEAFVERALADLAASYGGVMVSVGHRLGLYQALAGQGPVSSDELAARTGCEERYVREWLNSQVAGGYLGYHEESETYELPAEHVPVLADEDEPGVPAGRVRRARLDVARPGADARGLPHGRRRPLGRAPRTAPLRRGRLLSERLRRRARAGVAAGARRCRREAASGARASRTSAAATGTRRS